MTLFQGLTPDRHLWVSIDGTDVNNGSREIPFGLIQVAVDAATPGTAVLVQGGIYHQNVEIGSSGTESAPIWIVSAEDQQPAPIVPLSESLSAVYGRGVDNVGHPSSPDDASTSDQNRDPFGIGRRAHRRPPHALGAPVFCSHPRPTMANRSGLLPMDRHRGVLPILAVCRFFACSLS